ncbi:MAG: ABC transporter permease [Lentisphaeria bacterium]|nr:ABC transporter permease [Lentisphaeria bacterium]
MSRYSRQLFPFCALVLVFALCGALAPERFLAVQNLVNILRVASVTGIAAVGMTFVVIIAGIDLSVGAMLALSAMVSAVSMLLFSGADMTAIANGEYVPLGLLPMLAGTLCGIFVAGLAGFLNGQLIARLKLAPFLTTLGTMVVFRSGSLLINDGRPAMISDYSWLDVGKVCGIPAAVALFLLMLLAGGFLLQYTTFGRYVRALGSSPRTALHAGVDVTRLKIGVYTLCGVLVGVAALIRMSRASAAYPFSAGVGLELDVIAAVLIGGASPSGGRGTMAGTLIGVLLVGVLRNGMTMLDISTYWQMMAVGILVLAALAGDRCETLRIDPSRENPGC